MDQTPQDQNSGTGNTNPSKNSLDLDNILLPKKEVHSADSAQRVDAGTLLNQEQSATLKKPVEDVSHVSFVASAEKEPPSTPATPQESIPPLQTFQGDIASAIQGKGMSVVSIAAAEAQRRGTQSVSQDAQLSNAPAPNTLRNVVFALIGLLFVGGAVGALAYILLSNAPLAQQQASAAPYITIDSTVKVPVSPTTEGPALMQQLVAAKNAVSISLGLVAQLYIERPATSTGATPTYVNAQTLFSLLAPDMPETLVRDIAPVYLLGVHSFGVNQPFLVLKVDSYEQAYAGMLTWEQTMKKDLSPLFTYVPAPKITAPKPDPLATSTAATSSTPDIPTLQTGFVDAIVINHDARVMKDRYGTIYFMWTFLDRQTLVITTNPDTLREIIARLKQSPILSQPTAQ